jgi:SET domain-containing protein
MIPKDNKEFFLEKRKSKIDGFGVFTKKPILKGEMFYVVPVNKVSSIPVKMFAMIGDNRYVNDEVVLNWVNHSCNANTRLDLSGQLRLVALRNIEVDEEIACDYNETEIGGAKAVCKCGDKKCIGFFLRVD